MWVESARGEVLTALATGRSAAIAAPGSCKEGLGERRDDEHEKSLSLSLSLLPLVCQGQPWCAVCVGEGLDGKGERCVLCGMLEESGRAQSSTQQRFFCLFPTQKRHAPIRLGAQGK